MTYETKTLLKAALTLIGLAALLIGAALLATSCDASQFAPFRAQDDSRPLKRYTLREDLNPCSRAYEAMESAKERIHPCSDTCRTPSAGQFNLNP